MDELLLHWSFVTHQLLKEEVVVASFNQFQVLILYHHHSDHNDIAISLQSKLKHKNYQLKQIMFSFYIQQTEFIETNRGLGIIVYIFKQKPIITQFELNPWFIHASNEFFKIKTASKIFIKWSESMSKILKLLLNSWMDLSNESIDSFKGWVLCYIDIHVAFKSIWIIWVASILI